MQEDNIKKQDVDTTPAVDVAKPVVDTAKPAVDAAKSEDDTKKPESGIKKLRYRVIAVKKTETPEGLPGDDWHSYVIGHGSSKIEGKKPGTLKDVTLHAETVAEDLNLRTGRGGSTYAPRKRV